MLHELLRGKVLLSQSLFDLEERIDACQGGVGAALGGGDLLGLEELPPRVCPATHVHHSRLAT